MNLLDYILIIIIAIYIINGYFKGLFKELIDIFGFILGLVIFKIIYPSINSEFLNSNFFLKLKNSIAKTFNLLDLKIENIEQSSKIIDTLPIPDIIKSILQKHNTTEFYEKFNVNAPIDYIVNFISIILMVLISIFFIVLIVRILIGILGSFLKLLKNFYLFDKLDKIGGIALGIVNGIFTTWLIGIIIIVLSSFPQFIGLKEQLNGFLAKPLINDNFLVEKLLNLIFRIM